LSAAATVFDAEAPYRSLVRTTLNLKGIVASEMNIRSFRHLLTPKLFQTCMNFFFLLNTHTHTKIFRRMSVSKNSGVHRLLLGLEQLKGE